MKEKNYYYLLKYITITVISLIFSFTVFLVVSNFLQNEEKSQEKYAKLYVDAFYSSRLAMDKIYKEWRLEMGCEIYDKDTYYCSKIDKYVKKEDFKYD